MIMNWMPMDRRVSEHAYARAHAHEMSTATQVAVPRVDVVDEGDAYQLIVEMPGVTKDSLSVHLEAEGLLLRGTRKAIDSDHLLRNGRCADLPFEARFSIGADVDRGKITARLEDGLVYVQLPRREEDKPRKIEIEIQAG
jgi:HSP20 family protein